MTSPSSTNELISDLRKLSAQNLDWDGEFISFIINNIDQIVNTLEMGVAANNVIQTRKSTRDALTELLWRTGKPNIRGTVKSAESSYESAKITQQLALDAYNALTGENIVYV